MKTFILMVALLVTAAALPAQSVTRTCAGVTVNDKPCKMKVKEGETYCHHHNPNVIRCGYTKPDGEACRMRVKTAGQRCHHHQAKVD
jgi:hypothetical protein